MYITYQEFCNITDFSNEYGYTLSSTQFERYELKARMKVDYYTQNRIRKLSEITHEIKVLMVELILLFIEYDQEKSEKGIIQSVSNDGYSVTYQNNNITEENELFEVKLHSLITDYATEYCFRGVEHDESILE